MLSHEADARAIPKGEMLNWETRLPWPTRLPWWDLVTCEKKIEEGRGREKEGERATCQQFFCTRSQRCMDPSVEELNKILPESETQHEVRLESEVGGLKGLEREILKKIKAIVKRLYYSRISLKG